MISPKMRKRTVDNDFSQMNNTAGVKSLLLANQIKLAAMLQNPNLEKIKTPEPHTHKFLKARSGNYDSLLNYIDKTRGLRK